MTLSSRGILCGAVAFLASGCADLAGSPDIVPSRIEVTPGDTMIDEGDVVRFSVAVFDQNDQPMPDPPSWAPPQWENPDPVSIEISEEGDVRGLKGAEETIVARLAGLEAGMRLRVNPSSVRIDVPSFYFNQINQDSVGGVPVIAKRQALLRVFVTGDQPSFYEPTVRAEFHLNGEVTHTVTIEPPVEKVPRRMNEGDITNSYNAVIPGHVFQPGVEVVIEVDPEGKVPMSEGSRARIPAEGALRLNVVDLPVHHQVIVPTIFNKYPANTGGLAWTRGLTIESPHILPLRERMPIADITVEAHETLYTDADPQPGTTDGGWVRWRSEVQVLWRDKGEVGNYYGAGQLNHRGGIRGLASAFGSPHVSVGHPNASTFVHEVGHTLSLRHAPGCGAQGTDPSFPTNDGRIGTWGYSFVREALMDPSTFYDLMSYCDPEWISAYHFARAIRYRRTRRVEPPPPEQTLLLWGSASEEEVVLYPAFLIETPPTRPAAGGPYRLEGLGPAGEVRFSFGFTPTPLDHGGAMFLFALPYDPDRDGHLERIVLSGPDGEDTLSPGSTPPMAILRDGATGTIRAFLQDWDGTVPSGVQGGAVPVRVLLSDGIPGGVR